MPHDAVAILADVVCRRAEPGARDWFLESIAVADPVDGRADRAKRTRVAIAIAGAGRRLGGVASDLAVAELRALEQAGLAGIDAWTVARCARVALVLTGIDAVEAAEHEEFVDELFRTGDNAEREALLGCLCALPQPQRFLDTAVESCRTNVDTVFAAIACENRYPERHFPDAAFNQMVLKAIFTGLPVRRILGLARRTNAELARMVTDYARERAAAGRVVPDDVEVVASLSR